MSPFLLLILVPCLVAMFIGGLMVLMAAFRQSVGWGLAYLFVPLASLVFLVVHWQEAKKGFLLGAGAAAVFFVAICSTPEARASLAKAAHIPYLAAPEKHVKRDDLAARLQEQRDRIFQMQEQYAQANAEVTRQYKQLGEKRKILKTTDQAAIHAFNDEAAAYQKQNALVNHLQQEIDVATREVDALLAERAKQSASDVKRVVIYTTSTCPACKAAKQYMTQKGINYQEMDVNQSPQAFEEFRRFGGQGVPLIRVGDKQMEGFNAQALDAML